MRRFVRAAALLSAAGSMGACGATADPSTNALSAWQTDAARVLIRAREAPSPEFKFPAFGLVADPRHDLRLDLSWDLGGRTRLDQRHGLEFSTLQPTSPPGLPSVDSAPLVRSSANTLTFAPLDGLDFALGTTLRQSVDASGFVAWETVSHAVTLGSNPWPEGRIAFTLRQDERAELAGFERAGQGLGVAISQKLPSAPLRFTLAPEWREATGPVSAPGTPEAAGARLAGSAAWDLTPTASWSFGTEVGRSGDDSARLETQSLNSTLQLRPASDLNLSLNTRYSETRRGSIHAPDPVAKTERDLLLRLSPTLNLNDDVTAQLDFDINLRDNPTAAQPAETAGGVSFSIRGRF